ncbi:MAG TPA: autotransporter-associated beta strand repeat-containing protein [Vicinamibacterales bacterium]|nr:autotransporter-associated beta strand repeat-containing protein [Vicinamibacterales bacterium]
MSSLLWNNGSLIKRGPGSAILTSANEYLGTTTINGGILSTPLLANGGAVSGIGMSSNAAANLILNGGTLQYSGGATSTDHLFTLTTSGGALDASGNGPLTFSNTGAIALSGSGDRRLTLTGTNTGANTLASVLGDGGGPTSLTKSGNGTWVLTGTNTYSGVTNVTAGRLVINGDQSGATGAVSVASGATLNGTGTIGGNVVIGGGGTFAPGNPLAPGTLTIDGDLALGSGSSVSYQLGQATVAGGALNDLTVVRGNLTLGR